MKMGNACRPMALDSAPDIQPDNIDLQDTATFVWEME